MKDKFNALSGLLQQSSSNKFHEQAQNQSIHELKKNDLFDLGVLLTICATDGIDMVNEEYVGQLLKLNQELSLFTAIKKLDEDKLDPNLKSTLFVLKRMLNRISPEAQDFISLLM